MLKANAGIVELFSEAEIAARVQVLGREVADDIGPDILLIAVLKGSFVFTADLMRALHRAEVRPQVDFMQLSSYGSGTQSKGRVEVVRDVGDPIEGRTVLLVDDILESGRTLSFAKQNLLSRGAREVRLCVLLDKPHKRVAGIEADFVGFTCPDHFVVGYGLDYAHYHRELPFIGVIEGD
ncbi:MAG TPA: hypoxanthine phosphoribosyltransferase [Alphaproteobacteria bacterium]|nr:hypoxanthine phosphoribosyltransferase [Alphaproteobacteria bacterium]HJP20971.1 hypoxanthine phosphoribosyltransferase [Alphaproteobacteria bacterium]